MFLRFQKQLFQNSFSSSGYTNTGYKQFQFKCRMCVTLIDNAGNVHKDFPLIICMNRDASYRRPTTNAQFWKQNSNIISGKF